MVDSQQYSSASTSVNSTKVPAVFSKIQWVPGTRNLDWGGGKYDTATQYLSKLGCHNFIYDPFNRSPEHNAEVLAGAPYDTGTISNVLNVVSEVEERRRIVFDALANLKDNGLLYISVYEGDRTGIGHESKKDCWQTNMRLAAYVEELKEFCPVIHKNIIIIRKEKTQ